MRTSTLSPCLLAATLFLGGPAVAAAAEAPAGRDAFRARMLELFDENKDGRLDPAEQAKARKYAEELGFVPDGPMRRQLMQRFDKNGNGKIDDDEQVAVREFMRQRMAGNTPAAETPAPTPPAPETVDPAKLALERTIRVALATDPVQLKRFDRDGDGQLSNEEWAVARKVLHETLGDPLVLRAMTAEDDERKLKELAVEVARQPKP